VRVALLTYSTRPRGGVVHTLALAEALVRRGHEVTVWTLGRGGDTTFFRRVDPAVRVVAVPFPAVEGEEVGERIVRSIAVLGAAFAAALDREGRPDVVHAQDCISANAVGGAVRAAGLLLVRTVHHLDDFTTPQLVACHDAAVREPDARVCVSAAVAAEVRATYGLVPTVVPGGVDADRFAAAAGPGGDAARDAWRARLGRYVLAVGGVEPRKGTTDLLDAWALLRRRRPDLEDLRLVVAGGETLFDHRAYRAGFDARAATLAEELGAGPVVLGTVDDDDLPPLVAAAAVLGFPSTKEGFGMAPLEALAAGVPVVARALPVLREVLGGAALLADDVEGLADGLGRALDGGGPPAGRGLAVARRHGWAGVAVAHEALYAAVLAGGGDDGAPLDLRAAGTGAALPVPAR